LQTVTHADEMLLSRRRNLHSHNIPDKPGMKVGMDIFIHSAIKYLMITGYFSNYFEFEKLTDMSAEVV